LPHRGGAVRERAARLGRAGTGAGHRHRRRGADQGRTMVPPTRGRGPGLRGPVLSLHRRRRPGGLRPVIADLAIAFGRVAAMMFFVLNTAAILGWVERKPSAIMTERIGANRASILGLRVMGLFHPLADTLKMLTKEDFRPARADRLLFHLAPFVSVFFALVAFASIPFGDTLRVGDRTIPLQAVTLNVGVLYAFAMLSLGVYGVMMAGWSSGNNYALLGGQRAAALMISAEIAIGASIVGVVMVY